MKVSVVGAGYVGLVTATCLAELGHEVICLEADAGKVELLRSGVVPIYEPGLDLMLQRNAAQQRLFFTTRLQDALEEAEVLFIAVGTPPREDGSADLGHVLTVARQVGQHMKRPLVIVNKSTVPVGTAERVQATVQDALTLRGQAALPFAVVSNPEFLKEGAAIEDFMRPDRIVIGLPEGPMAETARERMTRLYQSLNRHHERTVWMDVRSAELAARQQGGTYLTLRLRAGMYHRFHAPADCTVTRVTHIQGDMWNVNPIALKRVPGLYCRNDRAVVEAALPNGQPLTLVPVGAILVASVRLHFLGLNLHHDYRGAQVIDCDVALKRGQEMGWFEHGSTIVVLAPPGLELIDGLETGSEVRAGQGLLRVATRSPCGGEVG